MGLLRRQRYEQAVYALGKLKAREAVPVLLEDIDYPESIDALGAIGDPRAVPALRKIVTKKGSVLRDGKRATPSAMGNAFSPPRWP